MRRYRSIEERFPARSVVAASGGHPLDSERLVGDHRCWPCTVANLAVGLVMAWVPVVAVAVAGNPGAVPVAVAWGVAVTAFTVYRLVGRGFLPLAGRIATVTGLHERIGRDAPTAGPDRREDGDGSRHSSEPRDDRDGSG